MASSDGQLKGVVVFGLSKIPVGGEVLGLFAELLWPEADPVDTWDSIKDRTEASSTPSSTPTLMTGLSSS